VGIQPAEGGGGGGTVTVTAEVPFFPSDVAVTIAEPVANPVTSPLPFTLATVVLSLDQLTVRPLSGFPAESFGVAANWITLLTKRLTAGGLTDTDATGAGGSATTVMAAESLLLPLVA